MNVVLPQCIRANSLAGIEVRIEGRPAQGIAVRRAADTELGTLAGCTGAGKLACTVERTAAEFAGRTEVDTPACTGVRTVAEAAGYIVAGTLACTAERIVVAARLPEPEPTSG